MTPKNELPVVKRMVQKPAASAEIPKIPEKPDESKCTSADAYPPHPDDRYVDRETPDMPVDWNLRYF